MDTERDNAAIVATICCSGRILTLRCVDTLTVALVTKYGSVLSLILSNYLIFQSRSP